MMCLEVVNHEVWFEVHDGRVLLKWGHFPETDGKLDPVCITRAFAVSGGVVKPVIVGIDRDSSARGGLFLEFEEAEALAVEYDRGIYSLTNDGKWIFGRTNRYQVREVRHILGSAKMGDGVLGLELEIVERDGYEVLFRGKPVDVRIRLRNSEGSFEFEPGEEVGLANGINVLSARYVDDTGFVRRSLVTTLTVVR